MTQHIISVLRRPDGLFALMSSRQDAFAEPERIAPDTEKNTELAGGISYVEQLIPLADVPSKMLGYRQVLLDSWRQLANVEKLDGDVLALIFHVLTNSVPDSDAHIKDVPPLILGEKPTSPKASAAHPRAFRGTKHKPPKKPKLQPLDLRPHLCVPENGRRLLSVLGLHLDVALDHVAKVASYHDVLRSSGPSVLRPFGQCWRSDASPKIAGLPPVFRRHFLWWLRGSPWTLIAKILSSYWALDLEQNKPLQRCVGRLLSMSYPTPTVAKWLAIVARMPVLRRAYFTELLIESSAYWHDPDERTASTLIQSDALSDDAIYSCRMFYALETVRADKDLEYAIDGFVLGNRYGVDPWRVPITSRRGVGSAVERVMSHLQSCEDSWASDGFALTLWHACGILPGLTKLLDTLAWDRVDPDCAYALVRLLLSAVDYESDCSGSEVGHSVRMWQFLRETAPRMLSVIESTPIEYRQKWIKHLDELLWCWEDVDSLNVALNSYLPIMQRLCAPPFKTGGHAHAPLSELAVLAVKKPELWQEIQSAQDASFKKIEAAAARENDSSLIHKGLRALVDDQALLVARGFAQCPGNLFKAAKTLGVLSGPLRRELVMKFSSHLLQTEKRADMDICQLVDLIDSQFPAEAQNVVARRLREHVQGVKTLRNNQIERHRSRLLEDKWSALLLNKLHNLVLGQLGQSLPPAGNTSSARHALMVHASAEENRRSLRRLLTAYFGGHVRYADEHPANRAWMSRHPKIDEKFWRKGIRLRREIVEIGSIVLTLETDVLEVLRLGTYVGSCLGVGGGFVYSAASIALDINKHVVYARNQSGSVIARQLLAISEDDKLVCYSVYPESTARELREIFRDYDLETAQTLGIEVYTSGPSDDGSEGEVATILSQEFWDDGAWDLNLEGDEAHTVEDD